MTLKDVAARLDEIERIQVWIPSASGDSRPLARTEIHDAVAALRLDIERALLAEGKL